MCSRPIGDRQARMYCTRSSPILKDDDSERVTRRVGHLRGAQDSVSVSSSSKNRTGPLLAPEKPQTSSDPSICS
mgnify:FL=1|jgi:hypothetical protein